MSRRTSLAALTPADSELRLSIKGTVASTLRLSPSPSRGQGLRCVNPMIKAEGKSVHCRKNSSSNSLTRCALVMLHSMARIEISGGAVVTELGAALGEAGDGEFADLPQMMRVGAAMQPNSASGMGFRSSARYQLTMPVKAPGRDPSEPKGRSRMPAVTARLLLWRARHRTVGAEDAAVSRSRTQPCSAARALVKELAGVDRHRLDPRHPALGASDYRSSDHGRVRQRRNRDRATPIRAAG